ncbi:uncharacterized protein LOC124290869 [Haliotis rubra]|uniref:uncharacterized protein LOC124290869 n=1 Tax=Haliotis rubra TaxID=36100 RepID=UPI001EE624AE|nr:uncharacterized protein LOC124290869 [Haliotis rubra]
MAALHCCVPMCTNDSRYDTEGQLSFHRIPAEKNLRKEWLVKIRRDVGPYFKLSDKTRVCSSHFKAGDIRRTLIGKRTLLPGSVPSLFPWTQRSPSKRIGPQRRSLKKIDPEPMEIQVAGEMPCSHDEVPLASMDHDYTITPQPIDEQLAAAHAELKVLKQQLLETSQKLFFLERFSNDPQNINFYTGFKDYATLKSVFVALQPTATTMIRWTQMQRHSSNMDKLKTSAFR